MTLPNIKEISLAGWGAMMALTMVAAPAQAQTTEGASTGVTDLIVTATRREANIQDVPVSVSAFSADTLDRLNPRQLQDIQRLAPNFLVSQAQGVQSTFYSMRGVGTTNVRTATQASIGIFIDGVYQTSPVQSNSELFDIERVEVLRGPQGTLWGRNSMAGAIQIVTRQPDDQFRAFVDAQAGNYDFYSVSAGVSGPIAPGVLFGSIAISDRDGGGYVENPTTGSSGYSQDRTTGRASLRWTPTSAIDLTLAGYSSSSADVTAIPDPNPYDYRQFGSTDQTLDSDNSGLSFTAEIDLGGAVLTSITAADTTKFVTSGDGDGLPRFVFTNAELREQETFSQEVRLASEGEGPWTWLVGAYYYTEDYFRRAGETLNIAAIAPPLPIVSFIPSAVWTIGDTLTVETETYAVFGEAAYETGPWTFTLGARYTSDQQQAVLNQPNDVGFRIGAGPPTLFVSRLLARPEVDSEAWSPRGIVSYRWSEDVMGYASISRGFKGGGFNTGLDPNSVQFAAIDPEEMTNYEVGWKSTLAGGRLRLNGAAYYMDYSDLQVLQTINAPLRLTGLVNAADARIFGAELEGAMVFTDHLSGSFALGYNDAKFERYPDCSGTTDCDGNSLPRAPLWSGNAGLDYRRPVGAGARFLGNLLVSFTDDHFVEVTNTQVSRMKAVTLVDASVGFDFAEGRYAAILWSSNLLDEEHTVHYQSSPVQGNVYLPGPPMMYGLRLRARF